MVVICVIAVRCKAAVVICVIAVRRKAVVVICVITVRLGIATPASQQLALRPVQNKMLEPA